MRFLAFLALVVTLAGCARLTAMAPPQFANRDPVWVRPADVLAWTIPDSVGYARPCQKSSHQLPSGDFHCHSWIVNGRVLVVRRDRDARPCTYLDPCPSMVRVHKEE